MILDFRCESAGAVAPALFIYTTLNMIHRYFSRIHRRNIQIFYTFAPNLIAMLRSTNLLRALGTNLCYAKTAVFGGAILFMLLSVSSAFGQSQPYPSVLVNAEGILSLPTDQEFTPTYQISIDGAELNFQDTRAHYDFFSALNCDLYHIRVNHETGSGLLMLQTNGRETWTLNQWNEALHQKCQEKPLRNE